VIPGGFSSVRHTPQTGLLSWYANGTQGNYGRLMERYNETIAYLKSFPTADMRVLSRYQLDSCAVVGNAGSLLNSSFGGAIDSHDAVVRLVVSIDWLGAPFTNEVLVVFLWVARSSRDSSCALR
jgi:hypothetical protein